jgi:hypothetical protein
VDGLNPNPAIYKDKANDWLVWLNVGYILPAIDLQILYKSPNLRFRIGLLWLSLSKKEEETELFMLMLF